MTVRSQGLLSLSHIFLLEIWGPRPRVEPLDFLMRFSIAGEPTYSPQNVLDDGARRSEVRPRTLLDTVNIKWGGSFDKSNP